MPRIAVTTGRIHSYETFAAADGPGVRFLVFMSGCPFRCRYCHNPDTWARPPAFEATADEVLSRALRYRAYWGNDGGITASGGEPMSQAEFVAELFEKAKTAGVNTCLDTAAACYRDGDAAIERLLALSDTVLLDLKAMDDGLHRDLTGSSNAPVLACARRLAEIGAHVWVRRVLVPGLTDGEDDLRTLGEFVRSLGNVERVDVLPYHSLGADKWRKLGIPYTLEGARAPTEEEIARARAIIGC